MEGVIFEIGCICCRYRDNIRDKLLLLYRHGYDWSKRTPYMDSIIPRVSAHYFDECSKFRKASKRILNFAYNYMIPPPPTPVNS